MSRRRRPNRAEPPEMTTVVRCAAYHRASTEEQTLGKNHNTIDKQESRTREYCERQTSVTEKTWEWHCYTDEGRSAKNTDRTAFQKLIADIQAGLVDVVVATKLDRISRRVIDFYDLYENTIERNGVSLTLIEQNIDTSTPLGKAVMGIAAIFAQLERETISERTKNKLQWMAEQGLWTGGHILGYDLDPDNPGTLVVNKEQAKLVRAMFSKYLELGSTGKLVKWLNDKGHRTPTYTSRRGKMQGGRPFAKTSVIHILTNPTYLGRIAHKGQLHEGKHELIVDQKIWDEANHQIELQRPDYSRIQNEREHVYIFQGLIRCGECGAMMTPKTCGGRRRSHFYYQCTKQNHSSSTQCTMPYAPAPALEEAVIEKLKTVSLDENMIREIIDSANGDATAILSGLREERLAWEGKVKAAREKVDNLLNQIESGIMGKKIRERLREREEECETFEQQLADVHAEIDRITNQNLQVQVVCDSLTRFRQVAEGATPEELKRIAPLFVEGVTWYRDRVDLALFEHQVQSREDMTSRVNHLGGGARNCMKWLRRLDSNQRPSG